VNCAKTIQDRPGQPAYEVFAIKRRFQRCKNWPLGSRRPPYERMKVGYPLENVRFLILSTNLVREWLQIDTDLLRIITSTADELSVCTNIDDLERPWTPKIGVLVNFSLFLGYGVHWASEFSLKLLEIDKTTCVRNYTDALARLMSISSDFLFTLAVLHVI